MPFKSVVVALLITISCLWDSLPRDCGTDASGFSCSCPGGKKCCANDLALKVPASAPVAMPGASGLPATIFVAGLIAGAHSFMHTRHGVCMTDR